VNKGSIELSYALGQDADYPLVVTLTDEEGYPKKQYYDIKGQLRKIETTPDHETTFTTLYTYDYEGNKLTETDAKGGTTRYTYDNYGHVVGKQDALGGESTFAYNALNQVVLQQEPGGKTVETAYDGLDHPVQVKTYAADSPGTYTFTSFEYDAAGNVTRKRQGSAAAGVETVSADTSYVYDEMNRKTDEHTVIDAARTSHTHYAFDKNGNRTLMMAYANAEESAYRSVTYAYDVAGRQTEEKGEVRDADGTVHGSYRKTKQWDYAGNLLSEGTWNGSSFDTTQYSYDYKKQVTAKVEPYTDSQTKTTSYQYDKAGHMTSMTLTVSGVPLTTSYAYDGLGRLIAVNDALGSATRMAYDASGNRTKQVDGRYADQPLDTAPGLEYEYDAMNRMVRTVSFDGASRHVIDYREYDGRGNVTKEADGEGYDATNPLSSFGMLVEYDASDRKVAMTTAQTAADNRANGTAVHSQTIAYDGSDHIIAVTDALGRVTRMSYYGNGLLKEKLYPDGLKESYDYDLTGKAYASMTDRMGRTTTTYGTVFDKPYRIEYPDGGVETFDYSAKGEVTRHTDQDGNQTYFAYTPAGNLSEKKEWVGTDGGLTTFKVTKTDYDEANHKTGTETLLLTQGGAADELVSAGDKTTYTYDKAGRLILTSGPLGRETQLDYDRAGNAVTKKRKVGDGDYEVTRYTYDVLGRKTSEALLVRTSELSLEQLANAVYDNEYYDRILSQTSYSYTWNGQVKSKTDPNGGVSSYTYDLDRRLTKKTDPMTASVSYKYDSAGNLTEQTNENGAVTSYEYNELNRLIRKKEPSADGGTAVTRYVLDAAGNVVKQIAPNQYDAALDSLEQVNGMKGLTYTYDAMNRHTSTVSPEGEGIEYIQYSPKGLTVKVVDGLRYTGDMATSDGTVYTYDGLGQAIRKTDALGHHADIEYDVLGHIVKKTDERGYATVYTYNADGTLGEVAYPDQGTIRYTYDGLGQKLTETNQRGDVTTYHYNAFGKVREAVDSYGYSTVSKYDLAGNLSSQQDKRGSVTLYKYDKDGRLIEKRTPLELDESGSVVYAMDSYGYDAVGNVTSHRLTGSKDTTFLRETTTTYYTNNLVKTIADNSGAFTQRYYDKNGNLVKQEKRRDAAVLDVEKYEYDSSNRMVAYIRLADAEDVQDSAALTALQDSEYPGKVQLITGYAYDALGNKTKEIDPRAYAYAESDTASRDKYTTTYTYDKLNRPDKVIRKANGQDVYTQTLYDEAGNKSAERNERGYTTRYTYDSMNRLLTVTDAENHAMTYTYDLAGNKQTEQNAKGDVMTYEYDKLNRVVNVIDPYGKVVNHYVYDANGNVVKSNDAKGYLSADSDDARYGWLYTYDLANRLVSKTDPELAARRGGAAFSASYSYNPAGEKIKETDALGNATTYDYDEAGRLVAVTDALGVVTTYGYDKAGNKLYMTDGRGKTTQYTYGAFGMLREVQDAAGNPVTYLYDLAQNMTQMTDRKGYHTVYAFDNRNLLLSKSVTETGDSIAYGYDETGNRSSMTEESGISSYTYDGNNRLLSVDKDGASQLKYTYDEVGNVLTVTDKLGNVTAYTYDKSSRMDTVTADGKTTTYAYDENGNRESVTYPGGVSETYAYDKANRLTSLANKKPDGTVLSEFSYTYDDAGRQASKTDSYGATAYTYDEDGRIKKIEAPGKTTVYSYDKSGNRLSQNETYTSDQPSGYTDPNNNTEIQYAVKKSDYLYSKTNELMQLVERMLDASGNEVLEKTTTYLYDENGNEIRQKVAYVHPHTRSLHQTTGASPYGDDDTGVSPDAVIEKVTSTFDGFNRLKQTEHIKDGVRVTDEYVYDGDDLRTRKTARSSKDDYAAKVTNYLYDRQNVILETDDAGALTTRYVRGINYIARIDAAAKTSYYLFNGHGDVVQTVSESGDVENQYDYDIFGNPTLTVEVYANAIRYAGEFLDVETGLYYLRARYYNPFIGRFISEDSYWSEDANPLSLNRYTYVNNDPLRFVDPTGHSAAQVEDLIKQIDDQKGIWQQEEEKKAPGQTEWTEAQNEAHEKANELRDQLAQIQDGNVSSVKEIAEAQGNDEAGAWETYKKDVKGQEIEREISSGESVSSDEVDNYLELSSSVGVAKTLGRDVVSSDKPLVEEQMRHDMGLDANPVRVASVSDSIINDAVDGAKLTKSFAVGAWNGVKNNVAETWDMIKHPIETGKAIAELDAAFLQFEINKDPKYLLPIYVGINKEIDSEIERWQEGDKYDRAEQIGEYVGGGLTAVVGAKGLSVVVKQIGIASEITKGAAEAADISELVNGVDSTEMKEKIVDTAKSSGYTYDPDLQMFGKEAAEGMGDAWKSKVVYPSKPHTNKTPGHWEAMTEKAEELAKSDDVTKVYLNKGIGNEIPGVSPNRRPDIMVVRKDGKIDQYEVPSKTDNIDDLTNRMMDNQRLMGDKAGDIFILPPK
jgi:RHS repeat-associated protein